MNAMVDVVGVDVGRMVGWLVAKAVVRFGGLREKG